jgi:hypothetical protein
MVCTISRVWCDRVDALYCPKRNVLTVFEAVFDVGDSEARRAAKYALAAGRGDPQLVRGDYECGVGPTDNSPGDIRVYKETVK